MPRPLNVLLVEDSEDDALLILRALQKGGYEVFHERVETAKALEEALEKKTWDIILSDYKLPGFDGLTALSISKNKGVHVPFIIVSGTIGEDIAVAALKAGAHDYIMKDRLGRLLPAIERELAEAATRLERKNEQEKLRQAEDRYRSIFENAREGIYRSTPEGKIIMANRAMAAMFGYQSPEEFMADIHDVAGQLYVNPQDRTRIIELIAEQGFVHNYEAQLYRKDRTVFWVSMTMQAIRDQEGRIIYFEGIDEDITPRKKMEEERLQSMARLRKSLGGTVQAISMAVEIKDPYTSGHQKRTADLARSIAGEMGLSAERADFVRMAATIHDIGKIAIPAEILSKPTTLTGIEYSLIKTHAQQGYDILKDIEFPWPVAEVIVQHHERLDGSGYPQGLRGEAIILEARILAVADVVEAIATHRPYRPARGIEHALEEIRKNRGILYDADVVDACLRLFLEKNYLMV